MPEGIANLHKQPHGQPGMQADSAKRPADDGDIKALTYSWHMQDAEVATAPGVS